MQQQNRISQPVRSNPNLILKHEILSKECDIFRASLPRKIYFARLVKLSALTILLLSGLLQLERNLKLSISLVLLVICVTVYVLTRTIEERILFIKGLGIQYIRLNGFYQETCCNFYPLESIDKLYLFEAVDGWKYGHFLNIQLTDKKNVVLFENMKPPVEFLKRIYRKYEEIKQN